MPGPSPDPRRQLLSPPPGFRLSELSELAPGVRVGPSESLTIDSVYFDTDDLRLTRAGALLRHRDGEGWTVRLPTRGGNGSSPRELHLDGTGETPPGEAVDLLRAITRGARLQPVAHLRTAGSRAGLRDARGASVGSVADDEVSVLHDGRTAVRYRELALELSPTADPELGDAVVEHLRHHGAGAPDPTPGLVRALGRRAVDPADVARPPELPSDPSGADVVRHALASSVARLVAHDPGVRLGDDPEDVHQARVATRRLRSDLRTFRALLEPEWTRSLRDELRWLGGELGAVRDTEVLLDRLRGHLDRLPEADRHAGHDLVHRLLTRWDEVRRELLEALRGSRYTALLDRLVAASRSPALTDTSRSPAAELLPPVVKSTWQHLAHAVSELPAHPRDEALHQVRIRAKRCRYAAEAVAAAVGKPARSLARRLGAVQDVLGEHQDAVVAEAWLREVASSSTGREVFVAGELVALEHLDAARSRDRWPEAWREASRKRLRSWL